jgi:hypothetical protein
MREITKRSRLLNRIIMVMTLIEDTQNAYAREKSSERNGGAGVGKAEAAAVTRAVCGAPAPLAAILLL